MVLSDRILAEVARRAPTDVEALAEVRGIGALTLDAHGAALLDVVREHAGAQEAPR